MCFEPLLYSANALRCAVFSSSGRKKVAATVLMSSTASII